MCSADAAGALNHWARSPAPHHSRNLGLTDWSCLAHGDLLTLPSSFLPFILRQGFRQHRQVLIFFGSQLLGVQVCTTIPMVTIMFKVTLAAIWVEDYRVIQEGSILTSQVADDGNQVRSGQAPSYACNCAPCPVWSEDIYLMRNKEDFSSPPTPSSVLSWGKTRGKC